ncbi:uracil-DNA glycosylase [uncultured Methylibium sp.]|uniref:uracil-DNA glycosylase n=1 Tax=uncultured Methylibium sp. TaxID=381093 RepID=UPI0025DF2296|nr:uracil-DNA glycosylase [uncultured Methylibium sp.]
MSGTRLELPLDRAFDAVPGGWRAVTEAFRASPVGRRLIEFVDARVDAGAAVYPPEPLRALALTPLESVRVVILGQDPYHGVGQAEGLAFSVPAGVKPPPSLRNIFKELQRDLGLPPPTQGSLLPWARRGVLLLNTCLTVEDGKPASHANLGWEVLTDILIDGVVRLPQPVAFLLWGTHAQAKAGRLSGSVHRAWLANHPSPLSAMRPPRPFIGCGHFSAATGFLEGAGHRVDWALRPAGSACEPTPS